MGLTMDTKNKLFESLKDNGQIEAYKQDRIFYKCLSCSHQYSIHLSKKCPKCKATNVEKFMEYSVKLKQALDFIPTTIKINEVG